MKIKQIQINNICGIKHLDLTFNEGLNLICGENGVGKTTILKAIAHYYIHGNDRFIKKHYGADVGTANIKFVNPNLTIHYDIKEFIPGYIANYNNSYQKSEQILYFPSSRSISYTKLDALPAPKNKYTDDNEYHSSHSLIMGVGSDIKNWFVNRYLFSFVEKSLDIYQENNLKLGKKVFQLLDDKLCVDTVKSDYEIMLSDGNDKIYFEMLSDGYKSCIYILLGIIKELEYRFPETNAIDFDGIIMIDEIDLHLHPQWQTKLVKVLKATFPNAQIIATTHSPSVLQAASTEEIIPLYKDGNGDVHVKELHLGEYGLQGWTLEEIMKDVMGMGSTYSELYVQTINEFDEALYEDNTLLAKEKYEILCKMLHPKSTLRQILKIQMAGMEE